MILNSSPAHYACDLWWYTAIYWCVLGIGGCVCHYIAIGVYVLGIGGCVCHYIAINVYVLGIGGCV